ncbi:MAG: winged helix-turn-helix transcriptional regulator [Solirubrobacterales bacterium]|nr:winged helix-turn-helix transcriptional regulator [Solirubrobacterales bacterium]
MSHGVQGSSTRSPLTAGAARQIADTMQALATPSRLRILAHLREGPAAVSDLAAAVQMEPSAVSHQLRTLRHLGLVAGERAGRQVIYALYDDHVAALLDEAIFHTEHLHLGHTSANRRQADA